MAQQWLVDQGWLAQKDNILQATARSLELPNDDETEIARDILRAMILESAPAWLSVSVGRGEVRKEFIPEDAEHLFGDLFEDEDRDALLLAAASKHDEVALRALGEAGEEAVLTACRELLQRNGRPDLAVKARRVSLISDALGWDVSVPNLKGQECRLEVKCYRGPRPSFFITRHEFEVGLRRTRWYLVICRSIGDSAPEVVGWTTLAPIVGRMPVDIDQSAQWKVTRVRLDEPELQPGLPLAPNADSTVIGVLHSART